MGGSARGGKQSDAALMDVITLPFEIAEVLALDSAGGREESPIIAMTAWPEDPPSAGGGHERALRNRFNRKLVAVMFTDGLGLSGFQHLRRHLMERLDEAQHGRDLQEQHHHAHAQQNVPIIAMTEIAAGHPGGGARTCMDDES